jgi:putative transposase
LSTLCAMESRRYPTDLSDDEWHCISPHLPEHACRGRPRLHGLRPILDAVFYVLKSGCPWRMLPREFPPWKTVYDWFRRWRIDGTWQRLNALSCAGVCDACLAGIRTLARASWTPSR